MEPKTKYFDAAPWGVAQPSAAQGNLLNAIQPKKAEFYQTIAALLYWRSNITPMYGQPPLQGRFRVISSNSTTTFDRKRRFDGKQESVLLNENLARLEFLHRKRIGILENLPCTLSVKRKASPNLTGKKSACDHLSITGALRESFDLFFHGLSTYDRFTSPLPIYGFGVAD